MRLLATWLAMQRLMLQRLWSPFSRRASPSGYGTSFVRCPVFFMYQTKLTTSTDKVIDSSDVILHILDARDPLGTRCRSVEKYLKEEAPHKHLVFVLNKCDLVPTKVAVSLLHSLIHFFLQPPRFSQDTFRRFCVQWNLAVTFWGEEHPISESLASAGEDRWRPFWLKSWDWLCHHLS